LQRILDARERVIESFPDYREEDVVHLYVIQQLDRRNELGQREETMAVIGDVREISIHLGGGAPKTLREAGERAMLLELHDATTSERYGEARQLLSTYDEYISDPDNRVELLMGKLGLLEYDRKYEEALSVAAEVRAYERKKGEFDVMLSIVEDELRERIRESGRELRVPPVNKLADVSDRSSYQTNRPGDPLSSDFVVYSPYPNPFNPSIVIPFELPLESRVGMLVYDMLGRRVAKVADRSYGQGAHSIKFEASGLASGMYVLRIKISSPEGRSYEQSRLISLRK
jgi:hypothetical protein